MYLLCNYIFGTYNSNIIIIIWTNYTNIIILRPHIPTNQPNNQLYFSLLNFGAWKKKKKKREDKIDYLQITIIQLKVA